MMPINQVPKKAFILKLFPPISTPITESQYLLT